MTRKERKSISDKALYIKTREVRLAYYKEHYNRPGEKERRKARSNIIVQKNRLAWRQIFTGRRLNTCSICEYNGHIAAIDFHHVDPKKKITAISLLVRNKPTEWRLTELDKCVAICSNCHRVLHYKLKEESSNH